MVEGDDILVQGLAGDFQAGIGAQKGQAHGVKGEREQDWMVRKLGENHLVLRS